MSSFIYRPGITFEDTNLVGNVYFSNIVRWQNECRNEWLKATAFDHYARVFQGIQRFVVTEDALKFLDPVGASLGDVVEVEMTVIPEAAQSYQATFQICRQPAAGSVAAAAVLATGLQRFSVVDGEEDRELLQIADAEPSHGPAYVLEFPIPLNVCRRGCRIDMLDLIRWQGKCRERFLSEYAQDTLRSVINGSLILHTSQVGLQLLRDVQVGATDSLRLEMRLTHFKGGRLTMQFDYYIHDGVLGSAGHRHVATGAQSLCSKHVTEHGMAPAVFPIDMLYGLRNFAGSDQLQLHISEALDFSEESVRVTHETLSRDWLVSSPIR